ncbi:hypothetical protein [Gordonia polyisoprenivorans]|uniref:Uncharacterized protein n=1 Tax=Gordonia polyisoprenivorans TaxID=84595 RepID=A0A846WFL4_9ACTN|nr:hypothetical protein [Gordonia polyisoprenivorans]NKY00404.1 hypothetical protein [Gordonia polyisoprenivorans]
MDRSTRGDTGIMPGGFFVRFVATIAGRHPGRRGPDALSNSHRMQRARRDSPEIRRVVRRHKHGGQKAVWSEKYLLGGVSQTGPQHDPFDSELPTGQSYRHLHLLSDRLHSTELAEPLNLLALRALSEKL